MLTPPIVTLPGGRSKKESAPGSKTSSEDEVPPGDGQVADSGHAGYAQRGVDGAAVQALPDAHPDRAEQSSRRAGDRRRRRGEDRGELPVRGDGEGAGQAELDCGRSEHHGRPVRVTGAGQRGVRRRRGGLAAVHVDGHQRARPGLAEPPGGGGAADAGGLRGDGLVVGGGDGPAEGRYAGRGA